mmetsp:Transcript_6366/g.12544  ORF Transcript_6366/g.12544 Transcript_6366/m.12544 type:complete len:99 (+) Transcript_6366:1468-1764(+)
MLCGNPALLVQVTVSPLEMVTVDGSNTRAPLSAPSFTLAPAKADPVKAKEQSPTPNPAAAFFTDSMLAMHTTRVARVARAARTGAKVDLTVQVCIVIR